MNDGKMKSTDPDPSSKRSKQRAAPDAQMKRMHQLIHIGKVRRCPFCGVRPLLEARPNLPNLFRIRCQNHHCKVMPFTAGHEKKESALMAWNPRYKDKPYERGGETFYGPGTRV